MWAELEPQSFGEVVLESLDRRINRKGRRTGQAGQRRDQHNAATAALAHGGTEMVRQGDRPDAVQLDLLERVVDVGLQEGRDPVRGAGVVDQKPDVEAIGRVGHFGTHVGIGEVLDNDARLHPVVLARAGGDLVEQGSVARDQHEIQSARG